MPAAEGSSLSFVIPQGLQFCAYVGEQDGLSLAPADSTRSQLEADWRRWWHAVIASDAALFHQSPQLTGPITPDKLRPQLEVVRRSFDPPEFKHLASSAELRNRCRYHWPAFFKAWPTEEQKFYDWLEHQGRGISWGELGPDHVGLLNAAASNRFELRIAFVRWPTDYQHHVANDYVILGDQYRDASHAAALQEILKAHISRLV
jgi:hypothetical protein